MYVLLLEYTIGVNNKRITNTCHKQPSQQCSKINVEIIMLRGNVEVEGNVESIIIVSVSEMELIRQNRVGCASIKILEPNTTVFGSRIYILVGSEKGEDNLLWHCMRPTINYFLPKPRTGS